jgi:hypothetical protein
MSKTPSSPKRHSRCPLRRHSREGGNLFPRMDSRLRGNDGEKERRTALISAAVTGKIDVRHA